MSTSAVRAEQLQGVNSGYPVAPSSHRRSRHAERDRLHGSSVLAQSIEQPRRWQHRRCDLEDSANRYAAAEAGNAVREVGRESARRKPKRRQTWWELIDGECPISLVPICELAHPPFGLDAGAAVRHYYDAVALANFLVSRCDFIDPVNRRSLTHVECVALDAHIRRHHRQAGSVSVADTFDVVRRSASGGDTSSTREASSVLQHLFRFQSARRTDGRGRAIAFADVGLPVVDDDDIPDTPVPGSATDEFPSLSNHVVAPTVASAWRARDQGDLRSDDFPMLAAADSSHGTQLVHRHRACRRHKATSPPRATRTLRDFGTGWDD